MDSVKPSALNPPHKSKLARTIAKVLKLRSAAAAAGISPADEISKPKKPPRVVRRAKPPSEDEEAVLAKLFAGVSCVKSAYAELQLAQTPYDGDGIQAADEMVVAELKSLSELKRCYLKKQFDPSPEIALAKAEIQEQKSLLKTYETTARKLEYQARLKETELAALREKLEDLKGNNRLMEKKLKQSGQISSLLDNLHFSGLSSVHFAAVLRHAARSIRSFSRTICDGMRSSGWDLNAVARTIQPEAVFWREEHREFAVESFVSREIFEGFCFPNFHSARSSSEPVTEEEKLRRREKFFARFAEVKSAKSAREYLMTKPRSGFSSFVRNRYSKLVHAKMELSLTGSLDVRTLVLAGDFSGDGLDSSELFRSFSEMARRVWLLHCLAFAFEPEASPFQVSPGCRFSEVYMESVAEDHHPSPSHSSSSSSWVNSSNDDVLAESESQVAFTVIPGFRIGKTVLQSQVYLSRTLISRSSLMIGRRGRRGGSHA